MDPFIDVSYRGHCRVSRGHYSGPVIGGSVGPLEGTVLDSFIGVSYWRHYRASRGHCTGSVCRGHCTGPVYRGIL